MAKNGLVCNYYILNYGSALQCYATQKAVENIGYDIEAIKFPNIPTKSAKIEMILKLKVKQLFNPKAIANKVIKIKNQESNNEYNFILKERKKAFKDFIGTNLKMSKEYSSLEEVGEDVNKYDLIMLGSDQLLNPKDIIFGYHTLSFVPDNIKKVSYAASFGLSQLPFYVRKKAIENLRRFDYFSAREIRGAEIYHELTGKNAKVVVDPTLLIDKSEWDNISGNSSLVEGKYIFCYFIGKNTAHREIAKRLSELTGYKIILIRHIDEFIKSDEMFGDIAINDAGPKEFINLIKNAEYVLADSFHATIFSIIFQKKYFVLNRFTNNSAGSTNSRIDSLLKKLNLEDRRISNQDELEQRYKLEINYEDTQKLLNQWKNESKEYLKEAMEK